MDIKVLFSDFITEKIPKNQPGGKAIEKGDKELATWVKNLDEKAAFRNFDIPYNLLFEKIVPKGLWFIDDKFSYDMFENGENLREIDVIKKYHIGENPIEDYCEFEDYFMVYEDFSRFLIFYF